MRSLALPLAAVGLAAGALLAEPATAVEYCVGEDQYAYVCVDPPGVGIGSIPLCVYTGSGTCKPVDVPAPYVRGCPDVDTGGRLVPAVNLLRYECPFPSAVAR